MAAEKIFSNVGQGIFDDIREESGEPFQAVTGIETTLPVAPSQKTPSTKTSDLSTILGTPSEKGTSFLSKPQVASATSGLLSGLQVGGQQTGSESVTSADSIVQILGGAAVGGLVGGPIGAVAGGLSSGLSVFLGTRANKRKSKALKAKEDRYQKMVKQQLAREDEFRKQERFDKLEEQGHNRARSKMIDQWTLYQDFSNQLTDVINKNADLKTRFAKEGF